MTLKADVSYRSRNSARFTK